MDDVSVDDETAESGKKDALQCTNDDAEPIWPCGNEYLSMSIHKPQARGRTGDRLGHKYQLVGYSRTYLSAGPRRLH